MRCFNLITILIVGVKGFFKSFIFNTKTKVMKTWCPIEKKTPDENILNCGHKEVNAKLNSKITTIWSPTSKMNFEITQMNRTPYQNIYSVFLLTKFKIFQCVNLHWRKINRQTLEKNEITNQMFFQIKNVFIWEVTTLNS